MHKRALAHMYEYAVQSKSVKLIMMMRVINCSTLGSSSPPPKIAVKSFVEMTRYLLQLGKEKLSLLSERIAQNPLENYFGKQRARGGRCDNLTLQEAVQNAVSIRTQQSLELDRVQGNCRRKRLIYDEPPEVDNSPLPKRKRS